MEDKKKLEEMLDNHRLECLKTLHYVVANGNSNALKEIKDSYSVAIEAHTIAYLNNREELLPLFYKLRIL